MIANTLNNRPMRCIGVIVLIGLLFVPVQIPMKVLIMAGAALIWTYLARGSFEEIGLSRHPVRATLLWAFGLAAGIIAFAQVLEPLISRLFGLQADLSSYGALAGNADVALQLLGKALTSAAFGEEILFRGFLLGQLVAILGASNKARWVAIIVGGVLFGVAHIEQGPVGIIMTGTVGIVFGWAWFRSKRNLWAMILGHALVDCFGIAMLYMGWLAV